jgi:hypothetical protein
MITSIQDQMPVKVSQNEIRERLNGAMQRWKFAPARKRGRPSRYANVGQKRKVDASIVVLLDYAFMHYATLEQALFFAGIGKEAYYSWLQLNPSYTERIEALKSNLGLQSRFSVMKGVKYDSDLALKVLERTEPESFSLRQVVQHNVEFTGISLDKPKQAEQIVEALPTIEQIDNVKQ